MQDARVRAALLVICLGCLIGSGLVLLKGRQAATPPIVFAAPPATGNAGIPSTAVPTAAVSKHSARLYVDVAGAVRHPSLYLLPSGSRVMQAVMAAGGPSATADLDAVNLAEPVTDGEKVFVPVRGADPAPLLSRSPVTHAAASPSQRTFALLMPAKTAKEGGAGHLTKLSADSGEQVGLNSATLEQLECLPGVGPSMAGRILAYRQQAGGFARIEDLTLVTGIGPKKYAKIAPYVTLD